MEIFLQVNLPYLFRYTYLKIYFSFGIRSKSTFGDLNWTIVTVYKCNCQSEILLMQVNLTHVYTGRQTTRSTRGVAAIVMGKQRLPDERKCTNMFISFYLMQQ
jgi:hypothetical protein